MKQDKITITIQWHTEYRSRADVSVTDGLLPAHVIEHLEKALIWAKCFDPDKWVPLAGQEHALDKMTPEKLDANRRFEKFARPQDDV